MTDTRRGARRFGFGPSFNRWVSRVHCAPGNNPWALLQSLSSRETGRGGAGKPGDAQEDLGGLPVGLESNHCFQRAHTH